MNWKSGKWLTPLQITNVKASKVPEGQTPGLTLHFEDEPSMIRYFCENIFVSDECMNYFEEWFTGTVHAIFAQPTKISNKEVFTFLDRVEVHFDAKTKDGKKYEGLLFGYTFDVEDKDYGKIQLTMDNNEAEGFRPEERPRVE